MTVTVLAPFTVTNGVFGGAERVRELAKRTGQATTVVSLNWEGVTGETVEAGFREIRIPATPHIITAARRLLEVGVTTFDPIPNILRDQFEPLFDPVLTALDPQLIVLEHPWLLPFTGGRPFVYDAHNAEASHAARRFGKGSVDAQHASYLERRAVKGAAGWAYCSTVDATLITAATPDVMAGVHIPNGVTLPDRTANGSRGRLLFVGSAYDPNVEAARLLIQAAQQLPDYQIDIAGAVCNYLPRNVRNVTLHGVVSDARLDELFRNAEAFVNLCKAGSGTHLKVGRALAYGLPVVTTTLGARGYESGGIVTVGGPHELLGVLSRVRDEWSVLSGLGLVQAGGLTWDGIGVRWEQLLHDALEGAQ